MLHRSVRRVAVAVSCVAGLSLMSCSNASPPSGLSTVLPSPVPRTADPGHVLGRQVHRLLAARSVTVDEDLQRNGTYWEVRLTWAAHGSVVDASSQPVGNTTGSGSEIFRGPGRLLQRPVGGQDACWSPATGGAAARFERPIAQEVAVLRSLRARSGRDGSFTGSVSARAVLGILGPGDPLVSRAPAARTDALVPARLETTGGALEISTSWRAVLAGTGLAKGAPGAVLLRFRPLGTDGPAPPPPAMMCS